MGRGFREHSNGAVLVTYEQLGTRIKESEVRKKEFQARSILEWEYFVTPEMVLDQLVAELELDQERVISTGVFDGSIDELMSLQIEKIEKCRKEKGLGSVCLISGGEERWLLAMFEGVVVEILILFWRWLCV